MPPRKTTRPPAPETCPVCGEDVLKNASACPECGADHNSGWSAEASLYDGLNLTDDSFDYDKFVEREFQTSRRPGVSPVWWIAGVLLLLAFLTLYLYATG
jgi:hypothetical protein